MKSGEEEQMASKTWLEQCEHDFRLDEQVGTVCQLCGFVETKIKDILPPFVSSFCSLLIPSTNISQNLKIIRNIEIYSVGFK